MSHSNNELTVVRKKLKDSLGENYALYVQHLRSWFSKKYTKEEFDLHARRLMNPETVHIHNQFFLALLTKCQTLVSYLPAPVNTDFRSVEKPENERQKKGKIKKKNKSNKTSTDQRFQAVSLLDTAPEVTDTVIHHQEQNIKYCAQEGTLPDIGLIHGRMLVCAWEEGVDGGCEDQAVQLTMVAVQHLLKNIVTVLLSSRNPWKTREGMKHSMGCPVPNPWLANTQTRRRRLGGEAVLTSTEASLLNEAGLAPTARPQSEKAEAEALYQAALGISRKRSAAKLPLSLFDLLKALKQNSCVIPHHTVYSINMERIIMRLHHEQVSDSPAV